MALTAPDLLHRAWRAWKRFGKRVADIQARVVLTIFYYVIAAPFGVAMRLGADPLGLRARRGRGWQPRSPAPGTLLDRARRQF